MLEIKNLHAKAGDKEILKGVNLTINDGEIHALMGTNGAGKSTLSNVIVGNPAYEVTEGEILFNGQDLLSMSADERANAGIFMSFQMPVEIPGVSMTNFMKAAVNARRKAQGLCQRGLLGRREEAQRDIPDGYAGAYLLHTRRDRLRS